MKIGIFVANAGRNSGGPETYEVSLLRALAKMDRKNEYHVFCFKEAAQRAVGVVQENFTYHRLWLGNSRPLSMLTSLPWQIKRAGLDYLHATFIPPPFTTQDYIYSLVCFSPFQHPEHYPPGIRMRIRALLKRGIYKSKLTLCMSENIRDLTVDKFKLPADKFAITYMAASEIFRPLPEAEIQDVLKQKYGIRDPYILFCGRWELRKNILGTLEAFAQVKKEAPSELKLVLTGSKTWASSEADALITKLGIQKDIIDLGKSPIEELPILYGGALALVYASFWEGFGMPIVEAMACGTPVITSNLSSMPEIAGSAALLVNPYSVKDLAEAIHKVTLDAGLRKRLSRQGLERAKVFSWEKTARQTLSAYERMAASA